MNNRNYINTDKIKNFEVEGEINAYLNENTPYPCKLQFGIPVNYRQGFLMLKVYAPEGVVGLLLRDFDCRYDYLTKNKFSDNSILKAYEKAWVEFMQNLFKDENYDENLMLYREEKQAKLAAANSL